MEVTGLVVGFVGLASMFSTCVDCFKLVQVFRARRKDFDVLQTMLDNQMFFLMSWGRACGFMDLDRPDERFDDPQAKQRNVRIEKTLESIQLLLTDTEKLKTRYGLRRHVQSPKQPLIEGPAPSAFDRAFQRTADFWNTALQRKSKLAGSVLWTVSDKDRFVELIEALKSLIENLVQLTEDMGIATNQRFIVEYEMEIINDEASLEAIAEASSLAGEDDNISVAARRQLEHTQERSALTQGLLRPDDSASMVSPTPVSTAKPTLEYIPRENENEEVEDILQPIGIHRVPHDQWRNVKSRKGILKYLPTLLVSYAPRDISQRSTSEDEAPNSPKDGSSPPRWQGVPTRLAINSRSLLDTLCDIPTVRLTRDQNVLVRPFTMLVLYDHEIRREHEYLSMSVAQRNRGIWSVSPAEGPPEYEILKPMSVDWEKEPVRDREMELQNDSRKLQELDCLLSFMDNDIPSLKQAHDRTFSPFTLQDRVRFDELCLVFWPGKNVMVPAENLETVFRITHVDGGRRVLDKRDGQSTLDDFTTLSLRGRCLDCNGLMIGPERYWYDIEAYPGTRTIGSLPILPISSIDDPRVSVTRETIIGRGKKVLDCMRRRYLHHCGLSLDELCLGHARDCERCRNNATSEDVDSSVIIDHAAGLAHFQKLGCIFTINYNLEEPTKSNALEHFELIACSDPFCDRCSDVYPDTEIMQSEVDRALRFAPKVFKQALTLTAINHELEQNARDLDADNLYMFFRPQVFGYSLRDHRWHCLHVDSLNIPHSDPDVFNSIVLPDRHKNIIQAFVESQLKAAGEGKGDMNGVFDLVQGKKRSLVLLFHGPPGVGKTSTAEAIAVRLGSPLLYLTYADLGRTVEEIRASLANFFSLAEMWNCVLVLGSADILLARVNSSEVDRNAVQAVFLQQLEYFTGILILLTSKVGEFDESIRSRIHVALRFPSLERRAIVTIWRLMLDRLSDTGICKVETEEILEHIEDHYDQGLRFWNGRQIRNACQAALALAEHQHTSINQIRLSLENVKTVLAASEEFEQYFLYGVEIEQSKMLGQRSDIFDVQEEDISERALGVQGSEISLSRSSAPIAIDSSRPKVRHSEASLLRPRALTSETSEANDLVESDSELEELELERKIIDLKLKRRRGRKERSQKATAG